MKKVLSSIILCLSIFSVAHAAINAQHSFENKLPEFLRVNGRGNIGLSDTKYKDGKTSVKFSWNGPVQLMFSKLCCAFIAA